MKMLQRLPELVLLALALVLVAALLFPLTPAPLPSAQHRPKLVVVSQELIASKTADPPPSVAEAASLFVPSRSSSSHPAPKPVTPPEKVAWLHFVAYAVASSGEKVYFFKNDQTNRVLMLMFNQPHDGWNLVSIDGGAYILEKDNHGYKVTQK